MKISRISKIKGYRLFRDFSWPSDLRGFGRYNLIYGWNGTGKTTLAALFRYLQEKTATATGEVAFDVDNRQILGSEIPSAVVPPLRVFDHDFVTATIMASNGEIAPIYFFGKDSVDKQKRVERLKKELVSTESELAAGQREKKAAEKALDDFLIERAKNIKELLTSARSPGFNNYDKRRFRQGIDKLDRTSQHAAFLQDHEKARLRAIKDSKPKPTQPTVACDVPDFAELTKSAAELMKRSVVSQVIGALASDQEVGVWVRRGLALHTGVRGASECLFCGQELPAERVAALEAHFNDAFAEFQADVDRLAAEIVRSKERMEKLAIPDEGRLYEHLGGEFGNALEALTGLLKPAVAYLGAPEPVNMNGTVYG